MLHFISGPFLDLRRSEASEPPLLSSARDRRGTSGTTLETHVGPFRSVPPGLAAIFPRRRNRGCGGWRGVGGGVFKSLAPCFQPGPLLRAC